MALKGFLNQNPAFAQSYEILECKPVHLLSQDDLPNLNQMLPEVDLLIHQPVSDNYKGIPQLSSRYLRSQLKPSSQALSFSVAYFSGYNPEMVSPKVKGVTLSKPFNYHDINLMRLYLEGKSITEALKLIRAEDFYSPTQAEQLLSQTFMNLEKRELALDIRLSPFIRRYFRQMRLFYTFNHPSSAVLSYIANCALEALELGNDSLDLFSQAEVLDRSYFPIYPALQYIHGLEFDSPQDYRLEKQPYQAEPLVEMYFRAYEQQQELVADYVNQQAANTENLTIGAR
jgi:hypothetical protein